MWRPVSSMAASFTQAPVLSYTDGAHLHSHPQAFPPSVFSYVQGPGVGHSRDSFNQAFYRWRQPSLTDISMHDYSTRACSTRASSSRQVTDPMSIVATEPPRSPIMDALCEVLAQTPKTSRASEKENSQDSREESTTPITKTPANCNSLDTTAVESLNGSKRQRITASASATATATAIDLEDESRRSASRRKVSSKERK